MQQRDVISIVEALYAEGTDEAWIAGVLEAFRPVVDGGFGVLAHELVRRDDGGVRCSRASALGAYAERVDVLRTSLEAAPREIIGRLFVRPYTAESMSETVGARRLEQTPPWLRLTSSTGCVDCLGLVATDGGRRSLTIAAPLPAYRGYSSRERRPLLRLATHLAAAYRLRGRAVSEDAIVDPSRGVLHAEGATKDRRARLALKEAVTSIERSRTRRMRSEGAEALALWRGLVEGRWSLVERFESDGRRYYVARRNELGNPVHDALTARERQVVVLAAVGEPSKSIAYALGITPSSVALHLSRAAAKLGARNRLELVSIVAALLPLVGDEAARGDLRRPVAP